MRMSLREGGWLFSDFLDAIKRGLLGNTVLRLAPLTPHSINFCMNLRLALSNLSVTIVAKGFSAASNVDAHRILSSF